MSNYKFETLQLHVGQFPKLLPRQLGETVAEFVPIPRQRLVDVFNQKKAFRACALTSALAVNGMRVV